MKTIYKIKNNMKNNMKNKMKTYFLRLFRTTFLFIFSPSMLVLEFFYNLVGRSLIEEKFDIDIKVKENKDGERD